MINVLWAAIGNKKESNSDLVLCLKHRFSLTFIFLQGCLAPAFPPHLSQLPLCLSGPVSPQSLSASYLFCSLLL